MPQKDIDSGRSICVVGIASVRPVKLVIFRIGQQRRGAVTEALERGGAPRTNQLFSTVPAAMSYFEQPRMSASDNLAMHDASGDPT
jgi:hypothetical protein